MNHTTSVTEKEEKKAVSAGAEGAIPPTGGVPPQDAAAAKETSAGERSAAEDLVDGIDLMLRAARKTLRSVDPRIEAAAARAVTRLQEFDDALAADLRRPAKAEPILGKLALDAGREMAGMVEQLTARLEKALAHSAK
jgi:hypothetical protein